MRSPFYICTFILCLALANALDLWTSDFTYRQASTTNLCELVGCVEKNDFGDEDGLVVEKTNALGRVERRLASEAWCYFEKYTDPLTGLAPSTSTQLNTTMWEISSQLVAILSAERLSLISLQEAEKYLSKIIISLKSLPLIEVGGLPNKSYEIEQLSMMDYQGVESDLGIGWSAIDVGRISDCT